ncbi:MAG: pilus assembly protein TadG-related protein, partial [Anaerolineae bacterium]|jgi:hypothetical protein
MVKTDRESGQSILIIALVVMVLLALVALVVDVGNAYAHRRMVQNAVDAAAMAGARMLAFRGSAEPLERVMHIEVAAAVYAYAEENGLVQEDVRADFVLDNGTRTPVLPQSYAEAPRNAVGVWVEGDLPFNTYFAHLLGFPTMQVTADAAAYHTYGPCSIDDCIFPVIVSDEIFATTDGEPVIGELYTLWVQTQLTPGNFGWIYWVDGDGNLRGDPPQGPEVKSLEPNLIDNCRSGGWQAGEWVHGDNGVNFQPVLDILEQRITGELPPTVTIPIYDVAAEQGNNSIFRIVGFGAFRLVCAHASRAHFAGDCGPDANKDNTKYLTGVFLRWHIPEGFEDGCIDTGVTGVSFRPPKSIWMPEWTEDN